MANEANHIINDIKKGNIKPIYFLMGEEPYYIDKICDVLIDNVLEEAQRSFNQMTLYGKDIKIEDIVYQAKRYPMMSDRQLVIVKEAQDLSRTIEKLASYIEQPQPTTVLVICYKYKKLDKRKKLHKLIAKQGVIFEGKKYYDYQVTPWIEKTLGEEGYSILPKASQMLVEFLGTDLGKIQNELSKLKLILTKGTQITPQHIEENIGISKDFNNFELRKAIGSKNKIKAFQIITYFNQNPKDNPVIVTISLLYSFFIQLMMYHGSPDKSKQHIARLLKINPFFVDEYATAARYYPMKKVSSVIAILRDADLKSKGVGASPLMQRDILKEVLIHIMG